VRKRSERITDADWADRHRRTLSEAQPQIHHAGNGLWRAGASSGWAKPMVAGHRGTFGCALRPAARRSKPAMAMSGPYAASARSRFARQSHPRPLLRYQAHDGRRAWPPRANCAKAGAGGLRQLEATADTLVRHAKGILSYYHTGLTSQLQSPRPLASAFGLREHDFSNCVSRRSIKLSSNSSAKTKLSG
jgi:hypothetical protein